MGNFVFISGNHRVIVCGFFTSIHVFHPSLDFHESCIVHTAMQKCHFPCEHSIRRLEQNIKLAGVHAYNFYLLLKGGLST